jgi:hypothetical protein
MRIWVRILLLIKLMEICDHWSVDPPRLYFEPPGLHCERLRLSKVLFWALKLLDRLIVSEKSGQTAQYCIWWFIKFDLDIHIDLFLAREIQELLVNMEDKQPRCLLMLHRTCLSLYLFWKPSYCIRLVRRKIPRKILMVNSDGDYCSGKLNDNVKKCLFPAITYNRILYDYG